MRPAALWLVLFATACSSRPERGTYCTKTGPGTCWVLDFESRVAVRLASSARPEEKFALVYDEEQGDYETKPSDVFFGFDDKRRLCVYTQRVVSHVEDVGRVGVPVPLERRR